MLFCYPFHLYLSRQILAASLLAGSYSAHRCCHHCFTLCSFQAHLVIVETTSLQKFCVTVKSHLLDVHNQAGTPNEKQNAKWETFRKVETSQISLILSKFSPSSQEPYWIENCCGYKPSGERRDSDSGFLTLPDFFSWNETFFFFFYLPQSYACLKKVITVLLIFAASLLTNKE